MLDQELARLPELYRTVIVLCDLQGKTRRQAALLLGCAEGTVASRRTRGLALLAKRLARHRQSVTAGALAAVLSQMVAPASVSASVVSSTIKTATLFLAGNAVASGASATVVTLTEEVLRAMLLNKLKSTMVVLLLAVAVLVSGGALLGRHAVAGPGADAGAKRGAKPGADTGRPIRSLPGHTDRLTSVAFSPDGRWIATAAWDGTARLWDAQTGKEVRRLDVPPTESYKPAHLSRIGFSPDNEFVVIAQQSMPNEPGVIVWNRRTGERVRDFPGECAAVSPDGKHIACGGLNGSATAVRIYEFPTGKLVREMRSQQDRITSLTFSPDGSMLSSTGPLPRPVRGDGLTRLGFMPDVLRVWDVATGKERRAALHEVALGGLAGQRLALSPDGRTLAVGSSLLENATGGVRANLTGHAREVCGVAFSPDGRTLATAGADGTVRVWDLPSGKELDRFGKEVGPFKGGWVLSVAFSPDGRTLVSGRLDKTAHIWDVSRVAGPQRAVAERSPAELEADWKDLAGNSVAGYAALGRLVSSPASAVAFLGKQLQSIKPVDTKRLERLLADLDSDKFAVREQATRELKALAENAVPALRKALTGKPSLESRRRLEALLHRLESASLSAETVRQIRAVEALESIGNPEALRLLEKLAAGPAEMRLTQEALASARRLAKRASVAP